MLLIFSPLANDCRMGNIHQMFLFHLNVWHTRLPCNLYHFLPLHIHVFGCFLLYCTWLVILITEYIKELLSLFQEIDVKFACTCTLVALVHTCIWLRKHCTVSNVTNKSFSIIHSLSLSLTLYQWLRCPQSSTRWS